MISRSGCLLVATASVVVAATLPFVGVDLRGPAVARASDREVHELTGFTSPSGNIGCYIDPAEVRCDIRQRNWAPPPKPASCPDETGWGQGLVLRAGGSGGGGTSFVCTGDTALASGPPLAYGDTITAGSLRCESKQSGMECWDFVSGPSFAISSDGYRLG
jgi:hypothetical protein